MGSNGSELVVSSIKRVSQNQINKMNFAQSILQWTFLYVFKCRKSCCWMMVLLKQFIKHRTSQGQVTCFHLPMNITSMYVNIEAKGMSTAPWQHSQELNYSLKIYMLLYLPVHCDSKPHRLGQFHHILQVSDQNLLAK